MKREMMEKFRALFETERNRLVFHNSVIDENLLVNSDDLMDEVDAATRDGENEMRNRLRNREALYLHKVDEALTRIKEGSFGECTECGCDIETKRLEVRPTTTLCVSCKEDEERTEHLHIDGHRYKSLGQRIRF